MTATRLLAVNDLGVRVGEDHQRAKLTNAEVDRLLDLHEEHGIGYRRLAEIFGMSKRAVRDICNYDRRAQHATEFRRAAAPTIEQRRILSPETMGPISCECAGCHIQIPYRQMLVLSGYRWCEPCYTIAITYAKCAKPAKNRENAQQKQLFAQQNDILKKNTDS